MSPNRECQETSRHVWRFYFFATIFAILEIISSIKSWITYTEEKLQSQEMLIVNILGRELMFGVAAIAVLVISRMALVNRQLTEPIRVGMLVSSGIVLAALLICIALTNPPLQ